MGSSKLKSSIRYSQPSPSQLFIRFSGGVGMIRAQCSGVHLIGVCFSPKMRLKLVKMALSSTMVSQGLGVCGFACSFNWDACYACPLHSFVACLQSSALWTWTPWWAPSPPGSRTPSSLNDLTASTSAWIRRSFRTLRMRTFISWSWRVSCSTPTGECHIHTRLNAAGDVLLLNAAFFCTDLWSMCSTNDTLFPFHTKNAKRGGGECHTCRVWRRNRRRFDAHLISLCVCVCVSVQGTMPSRTPLVCSTDMSGPCMWNILKSWKTQELMSVSVVSWILLLFFHPFFYVFILHKKCWIKLRWMMFYSIRRRTQKLHCKHIYRINPSCDVASVEAVIG